MSKILLCNWYELGNVRTPKNEFVFDELNNLLKEMGHDSKIVTLESVVNALGRNIQFGVYRYSMIDWAVLFKEYVERYEDMFGLDLVISNDCCVSLANIKAPIITISSNPFEKIIDIYKEKRFYTGAEELELSMYSNLQQIQLKKSTKIISVCRFIEKYLEGLGFKSTVIDNFVDTRKYDVLDNEKISETKKLHGLPFDKKIGLWAGVFRPEDGFEFVSKLVKDLQNVHWVLLFKEDITYKPLLKNVTLLRAGVIGAEYYNIADFFVNAGYIDGFGIEQIQAAACNRPIVTSKTGWFFDAESGDIGEVVKSQEYELYKEAVEKVLVGEYKPRRVVLQDLDFERWKEKWKEIIINIEKK